MNNKTCARRRKDEKQTKTGSERSSINGEKKRETENPKHDNVIIRESVTGHCTLLLTDQHDKQSQGEVEHHSRPYLPCWKLSIFSMFA